MNEFKDGTVEWPKGEKIVRVCLCFFGVDSGEAISVSGIGGQRDGDTPNH